MVKKFYNCQKYQKLSKWSQILKIVKICQNGKKSHKNSNLIQSYLFILFDKVSIIVQTFELTNLKFGLYYPLRIDGKIVSSFVPSAITQPFFELQTPDFAWKFVWTVPTNYEKKICNYVYT